MPTKLRSRVVSRCRTASTTIFENMSLCDATSFELRAVLASFSNILRFSLKAPIRSKEELKIILIVLGIIHGDGNRQFHNFLLCELTGTAERSDDNLRVNTLLDEYLRCLQKLTIKIKLADSY